MAFARAMAPEQWVIGAEGVAGARGGGGVEQGVGAGGGGRNKVSKNGAGTFGRLTLWCLGGGGSGRAIFFQEVQTKYFD